MPNWNQVLKELQSCSRKNSLDYTRVKYLIRLHKKTSRNIKAAKGVIAQIGSHAATKTHSRHVHIDDAKAIGLKVKSLEHDFDDDLQDLVLTVHYCCMHTFAQSTSLKIVENHSGIRMVEHQRQEKQLVPVQIQGNGPQISFDQFVKAPEQDPKTAIQQGDVPDAFGAGEL